MPLEFSFVEHVLRYTDNKMSRSAHCTHVSEATHTSGVTTSNLASAAHRLPLTAMDYCITILGMLTSNIKSNSLVKTTLGPYRAATEKLYVAPSHLFACSHTSYYDQKEEKKYFCDRTYEPKDFIFFSPSSGVL